MNIPDQVKPGQAVEAAHMNTLLNTVRMVRDKVFPRGGSGNDDTVSLHAFWADISMITAENPDKPMQAVIEQAYVHDLSTGENLPVFRHPLEQIKEFDEDDVFELVIYTSGSTVNAVRFVEEGEDDFDLQEVADKLTAADKPVPQDLKDLIDGPENDPPSGTKYRLKIVKFIKPVIIEEDTNADPPVQEVKRWDVIQYCKNDILWGGAGGDVCEPLKVVQSRPAYAPEPPGGVEPEHFWVQVGTVNNVEISNIYETHSLLSTGEMCYVYLECEIGQQELITVESATIKVDVESPDLAAEFPDGALRPTLVNIILAYAAVINDPDTGDVSWDITSRCGDITLVEEVIGFGANGGSIRNVFALRI